MAEGLRALSWRGATLVGEHNCGSCVRSSDGSGPVLPTQLGAALSSAASIFLPPGVCSQAHSPLQAQPLEKYVPFVAPFKCRCLGY